MSPCNPTYWLKTDCIYFELKFWEFVLTEYQTEIFFLSNQFYYVQNTNLFISFNLNNLLNMIYDYG